MRLNRKSLGLAAVVALGLATAGCDNFFDVERPNIVDAETIDPVVAAAEFSSSAYQNMLVAYGGAITHGAWFTNESRAGDTFPTRNEFGRRFVGPRNSTHEDEVWAPLALAMATSQEALEIMEELEDKDSNIHVARAAFASGYTLQLMAEVMCTGIIEPDGPAANTSQMLGLAAERFQRAATVAAAAGADTLAYAAKVGLGRTYLQAGEKAKAAEAVAGLPNDFVYNAIYVDDAAERDRLGNRVKFYVTSRVSLVTGPEWRAMADEGDTRIKFELLTDKDGKAVKAQDTELDMWEQKKFPSWNSPIRLASGLEAQYIEVEAGANVADIVAFVNDRRTKNGQPGVFNTTDLGEAMMELMDQRGRDFWLEGKRMGDCRRHGASEDFPYIIKSTAEYYKPAAGVMGNQTCMPLTEFETDANSNFK
jgi:hypothetical protein